MGCELSRIFVWRSKPGRKRLSSGDSDFRQDSESQDYEKISEKADDESDPDQLGLPVDQKYHQPENVARSRGTIERKMNRLRNIFSRKKSKSHRPKDTSKNVSPSGPASDYKLYVSPSLQASAELAVRNRDCDALFKLILQNGYGFETMAPRGALKKFKPVELACTLGYYDIVRVFLDNSCSPNLPTTTGKLLHTVLESLKTHRESMESGKKLVKHLIRLGCDVNIKDRCGVTPLMYCAEIGNHDLMQLVLEKCSDKQLTYRCSGSMYTPLHMSAMRGDFECVKLLLSQSPHKHVNEKDRNNNTALHLALKSMLHNIPYLNAAQESLMSNTNEQSAEKMDTCQRLMKFQQNAVAIVEVLLMAGACVHAACCNPQERNPEQYYPLVYALKLCTQDETLGFELDSTQLSSTLNLVSRQTIQSLEDLGKVASDSFPPQINETKYKFSPYAGVVRLLVLAGSEVSEEMRDRLYDMFEPLHLLLDEICTFWDRYQVSKLPKLVHLAKLTIRTHLADVHQLHKINALPLPPRMKEYVKLNYL